MQPIDDWDTRLEKLQAFFEKNGRSNLLPEDPVDKGLKSWIESQILLHKRGKLSDDKVRLLEALRIDWQAQGKQWDKWQKNFARLRRYAEKNQGDPNVSQLTKGVGPWLSSQRVMYRQGLLSHSKKVMLESIGVCWNPSSRLNDRWWAQFEKLKAYKAVHGHCDVPRREYPDPGIWVSAQRTAYKKGTLRDERKKALESIGFNWVAKK